MGRLHLFEIEDQKWCPRFIRETTTDFLAGLYKIFRIYDPAYEKIGEVLDKTKTTNIVDCCSGSGGPITQLREFLDKNNQHAVTITLTDKYPNLKVFQHLESNYPTTVIGRKDSLDAAKLPSSLTGMRTFFSSFHHFTPEQAQKILQDAVNNNAPIGIFESTQRAPADFFRALISPIMMLFVVPFAQRLNWRKFIGTYIIPITPFTNMWDYFVSNMRTYSQKELNKIISKLDAPGYTWETGNLWSPKAKCNVPYLVGYKQS
jgi:hypothetical protein